MSSTSPFDLKTLSPTAARLARQIPRIYLGKNESVSGKPLLALLEVLADPIRQLEIAVEQLADDRFIERASAEGVALLAELVGARLVGDDDAANRIIVARTIHWRRHKGTLAILEEVIEAASGWSAEVDEAFRSLLHNQDLADLIPWRGRNAILWDPIVLADPLSRRAPSGPRSRDGEIHRTPVLGLASGESVEDALLRLGRADAGRHAASPRNIDFTGWAKPEIAVIRTSRFEHRELDRLDLPSYPIAHTSDEEGAFRYIGVFLDPAGRDRPLSGVFETLPPEATGGLTEVHEPAMEDPPSRLKYGMLTPTALAADGDAAEQDDNLSIFVDGVTVIGTDPPPAGRVPLAHAPMGSRATLRFADMDRPSPGETWIIERVAVDNPDSLDFDTAVPILFEEPSVGAENPVLIRSEARRGESAPPQVSLMAGLPRDGSFAALRLSRPERPGGYRISMDGKWESFFLDPPTGDPISTAAVFPDGDPVAARVVRLPGDHRTLAVSSWSMGGGGSAWTTEEIDWSGVSDDEVPMAMPDRTGPAFVAENHGGVMILVGPDAGGDLLGVWRITNPTDADPEAARIDTAGSLFPERRYAPAVCVWQEVLYVFGGETDSGILGDFWSLPLSGAEQGRWRCHRIRNRLVRSGGRLIGAEDGLTLLGGVSEPGVLDPAVWRVDVNRPRPGWSSLPGLPSGDPGPGALWARRTEDGIETLVWMNSLRPKRWRLLDSGFEWEGVEMEPENDPNPPAEGEMVFVDDDWIVLGAPPLPAGEVLFTMSADGESKGFIAFLPAVDPVQTDQWDLFSVMADGSTIRMFPIGVEARPSLRLGPGLAASVIEREAPEPRIGAPGKLSWTPLKLRQRSLGPWNDPLALDSDEIAALDPRLGRVLLPAGIARGRISASYRIARSAAIGAGFLPEDRSHPEYWEEPENLMKPGVPPELLNPITAWLNPAAVGFGSAGDIPVEISPKNGITEAQKNILAIVGSPTFSPERLSIPDGSELSLFASDTGDYPHFARDEDGFSLSLSERLTSVSEADVGPSFFLSGLSLSGGLDLTLSAGRVELRWCDIGGPEEMGIVAAGGTPQSVLTRRSIPESRMTLVLFGCILGRIEVPPWVRVIAAGSIIDGGDEGQPAIDARGAPIRLRHCTVRGRTLAGVLQASSCVFQGEVRCDRPDKSWVRYSLLPESLRPPLVYQSLIYAVSFASGNPTDPNYLVLASNNPPEAFQAGEQRRIPGAHAAMTASHKELVTRTEEFLPMGMRPLQIDRTTADLNRMSRRNGI